MKTGLSTVSKVLSCVFVSSSNRASYMSIFPPAFSESRNSLRICPVVIPSANPSFAIRPSSNNDAFLIGEYSHDQSQYFIFSPANRTSCGGRLCTELSIRYNIDSPSTTVPGRFTVNYVGSNGSGQTRIQIDYGKC